MSELQAPQFQQIPETTPNHQTASDILGNFKPDNIILKKNLSEEYEELLYRDNNLLRLIVNDIDYFTRLMDDCIHDTSVEMVTEISMLENLRVLSKGTLKSSGMFYSESLTTLLRTYPYLRNSSITSIVNNIYDDKHIYPICLPNGKVFTHMSYDTSSLMESVTTESGLAIYDKATAPKYQIASQLWVQQDSLIANLESLQEYDGVCVYVVEGYFDSKRINDQWGKKSVALLSSSLSRNKLMILKAIKRQGHCLVYVPDMDEAGTNTKLINNPIWDEVFYIPKVFKDIKHYKDIDNYVKFQYLNFNNVTEKTMDLNTNLIGLHKLDIPFHTETIKEKLIARRNRI